MVEALARPTSNRNRQKLRPLAQRTSGGKSPLDVELDLWNDGYTHVIGSDDSGQGCIAGPIVTASICILPRQPDNNNKDDDKSMTIPGVADSKLLSAQDRQRIYNHICDNPETYAWTHAIRSNTDIDEGVLGKVTMDCFCESILSLASKITSGDDDSGSDDPAIEINSTYNNKSQIYSIVDGKNSPAKLPIQSRPWVKGDVTVYTVALASIMARVVRDDIMANAAKQYPGYDFENHGGYPTKDHTLALHKLGPSPIHRFSTKPVQSRANNKSAVLPRDQFVSLLCCGLTAAVPTLAGQPQPSSATTTDPRTGIVLPDKGEIEAAVPTDWSTVDNPVPEREATLLLTRLDSTSDAIFYSDPRFVEHVDAQAVQLMTEYISNVALPAPTTSSSATTAVLDLCSSWTSHIADARRSSLQRVAGLGMNSKELEANKALTEWKVQDLNDKPVLPYENNSFDVVLCQLSIDYLTKPLEVCREIGRVLKPGGKVHILFSNRLFLSKAVALWTGADDIDHAYTVACYLHFSQGGLGDIKAQDLSLRKGRDQRIVGDPLYVVTATKV